MATYVFSWVCVAEDDEDANAIFGECDNAVGSFNAGVQPNGYAGFHAIAGGVVKIIDDDLHV